MVTFEKCDEKLRKCKSKDEIEQWLDSKIIIIAENKQQYVQSKPNGDRIERFSAFSQYPANPLSRTDKVKKVIFQEVERTTYPLGLFDKLLKLNERTFEIETLETRILSEKN
jgi:hypothetical protein